jgi:hypothetical protein
MTLQPILAALEATPFATAIRGESLLFPWIESIHVLAIVIVVGMVFVMDLRLLGVTSHSRSLHRVLNDAVPCVWVAFLVAAVSGFLLFSSSATSYAANPAFRLKFVFMALAGINMLIFHGVGLKGSRAWDEQDRPPPPARVAGVLSLMCWIAVVGTGRWIGFLST